MPLKRSRDAAAPCVTPCLGEGDDLPPDDRVRDEAPAAIDALYRSQLRRLLGFFRRRSRAGTADDLAQQTFTRFLAARGDRAVPIACPEAYLRQTARNLVMDDARLAQRRSVALHIPLDDVPLCAPDPVAALEARDMLRRLDEALLDLKARTREIFLAHRIDGYSYGEIAARTGLSVKGIEKHMSRAIAHLDKVMSAG